MRINLYKNHSKISCELTDSFLKLLGHGGGDHLCVLLVEGVRARLREELLEVHLGDELDIRRPSEARGLRRC